MTAGNRIVTAGTGEPILLRGVNRSGFEYSEPDEDGFASGAGISRYELRWIRSHWQANIIRLPFNQDWVLHGRGRFSAEDYLKDMDRIIEWNASLGMYTLIDLQWLDADNPFGPNRQFVGPLPNNHSQEMWRIVARRYREEPAVLFDIFNEPHDRENNDPFALWKPDGSRYPADHRRVSMEEWKPWARLLIDTIRAENPEALIWVSGTNWAYDLQGFPLDRPNLVYSTHIYRNKGENWDAAFGNLARTQPVFAGEWGGTDEDLAWGRRLRAYMEERHMGWTAWSWTDWPRVVERYAVTKFGEIVRGPQPT